MSSNSSPEEPEILNPGGKQGTPYTYRDRYTQYTVETKQASPAAFLISLFAFFISLLPIVGMSVALFAIIFSKIKHTSTILAFIAFVIGCVSTTIFLMVVFIFNLIF